MPIGFLKSILWVILCVHLNNIVSLQQASKWIVASPMPNQVWRDERTVVIRPTALVRFPGLPSLSLCPERRGFAWPLPQQRSRASNPNYTSVPFFGFVT